MMILNLKKKLLSLNRKKKVLKIKARAKGEGGEGFRNTDIEGKRTFLC